MFKYFFQIIMLLLCLQWKSSFSTFTVFDRLQSAIVAELHSDGGEERIDTSGRTCC